jgi:hypothetical protein
VAVSPDGRRVVSASGDETLKVWDLDTGVEVFTLSGHTDAVSAVAITSDGRRAISASWDKTLRLWDLGTGREMRIYTGHLDIVSAVKLSPDDLYAVSASWDKTLKVWDIETGSATNTFAGHAGPIHDLALSLDGRVTVSASEDKILLVWFPPDDPQSWAKKLNAELLAQQGLRRRGVRTPEFHFSKHFDNSRLMKKPDLGRIRDEWRFALAISALFAIAIIYGGEQFITIGSELRVETEKRQVEELREESLQLVLVEGRLSGRTLVVVTLEPPTLPADGRMPQPQATNPATRPPVEK